MVRKKPVLILAKTDQWSSYAIEIAKLYFPKTLLVLRGTIDDPIPAAISERSYSTILSFLSPWIIPASVLERTELALNFHPGSTSYPGIGCYNFALYEEAKIFGAVCHYMAPKVDTGSIIEEKQFSVAPNETVKSLKFRTMVVMLAMFHEQVENIAQGVIPPTTTLKWNRKPFSRKQLESLGKLTREMPDDEIKRRKRAMAYPGYPGAKFIDNNSPIKIVKSAK